MLDFMNWAYILAAVCAFFSLMFGFWGNEINSAKKQLNIPIVEKNGPAVIKLKDNSQAYIYGNIKTNMDTVVDADKNSVYVQTGNVEQTK